MAKNIFQVDFSLRSCTIFNMKAVGWKKTIKQFSGLVHRNGRQMILS